MDKTLQDALQLLVVGMTTVALVLGLVVLVGRLLISAVNRATPSKQYHAPTSGPTAASSSLDPKVVAVLAATVEHVTHGKGKIKTIDSSQ